MEGALPPTTPFMSKVGGWEGVVGWVCAAAPSHEGDAVDVKDLFFSYEVLNSPPSAFSISDFDYFKEA